MHGTIGCQDAKGAGSESQDEPFGNELAEETAAGSAEGSADRDFAPFGFGFGLTRGWRRSPPQSTEEARRQRAWPA